LSDLHQANASALEIVGLRSVMGQTSGRAEVGIGLLDGPVAVELPDFAGALFRPLTANVASSGGGATLHGTFVAGILVARRGAPAPAICPGCTLLVRPIFGDGGADLGTPTAAPDDVADAVVECVDAGARVVNLSAGVTRPTTRSETRLRMALDLAARRGALIVAAAGNQGMLGGSEITRHPAVVPVVGYDLTGRPSPGANRGRSMGVRGLGAPGEGITSLEAQGRSSPRAGTSFAAAFVTGAAALLWSVFPTVDAGSIRGALTGGPRRATVIPPLMDAQAALDRLAPTGR
jgi:subtilisin family serine protease